MIVKYHGINYEGKANSLSRIENVKTTLRFGNPENIPNPWITVLIPTYKRRDLLEHAIRSVLSQWHCDFMWDIVILDNEADDGKVNETERYIRKLNNARILYYRNSRNVRPADNFNRGLQIARGEWVCFLHDDDLLIANALQRMGRLIKAYEFLDKKPLGAISAQYYQFFYDNDQDICYADIPGLNTYFCNLPFSYRLFQLTHANLWMTANIGGDVPSNGTTFNRKAALECEGFVDEFGISGDLILFYRMENHYSVYSTLQPFGFYRWGGNSMSKPESTRAVIKDGYDFREYVYSKNVLSRIAGKIMRRSHYKLFSDAVIDAKNLGMPVEKYIKKEIFYLDGVGKPSKLWYFIYVHVIKLVYIRYRMWQAARKAKLAWKYEQKNTEELK